ncbi:MAG: beta-lactamase [Bacteroidota bacterium]|nr:beta-lactamase [Bacteroidota bacterium]
MKKSLLTISALLCCFCLTFCKHNSTGFANFAKPDLTPEAYETFDKQKINLQDPQIISKIHDLDCYFEAKVKNGFSGSVLISFKGTPIFERYYGYKNYRAGEKLTSKSTFQIASTSKTFTSGAILLLLQQKLVSLDDSIQKFFPEFPYKGITIRMLLSHRSGLPNYLNFTEKLWKDKKVFMTNNDVLQMMIRNKPKPLNSPDAHFLYNNTNFVLLALIVEKVSGMPFCDFMHQNIFTPLGMTDTWMYDPLSVRPSATKGYTGSCWREDEIIYTDGVLGDKGIYSTVRDMYKWDQALYAGKFIKPEILGMAFTPQSFEKRGNKNYGLGWRMQDQSDGTRLIYHNGWWHSYNTVFNRKISDKTSVIILSNHFSNSIYKIQQVWDILYGENVVHTAEEDESSSEITKRLNNACILPAK